ncbi:MAG: hypothetical protein FJ296_04245 [Planctomycetes bacterium]|nr:hypothetical protein [Planctomycetota bacterium]
MRTAVLALLLALPAAAQGIDTIDDIPLIGGEFEDGTDIRTGSIGMLLHISGSGFGGLTGLAKPKVFINSNIDPKKRALKVVEFTDNELLVELKKGVPGDYDLTIQPKGKDVAPMMALDVVRVVAPTFEQPNPPAAAPGQLVTLTGWVGVDAFGTVPGTVKVGGKKAKVESWSAGEVVFFMPGKLANGLYVVEVKNKVATGTVETGVETQPYCLEVVDSTFDLGGPDRFSCKLGKKKFVAPEVFLFGVSFGSVSGVIGTDPVPNVTVSTLDNAVDEPRFRLVVPVDVATAEFPVIVDASPDGQVELTICEAEGLFVCIPGAEAYNAWNTDHGGPGAHSYHMVLHGYEFNAETEGNQLVGTFVAELVRTHGDLPPQTYQVTVGDFRVTPAP